MRMCLVRMKDQGDLCNDGIHHDCLRLPYTHLEYDLYTHVERLLRMGKVPLILIPFSHSSFLAPLG
jgi:hypothetical protein